VRHHLGWDLHQGAGRLRREEGLQHQLAFERGRHPAAGLRLLGEDHLRLAGVRLVVGAGHLAHPAEVGADPVALGQKKS
jgi:hypothetical protein